MRQIYRCGKKNKKLNSNLPIFLPFCRANTKEKYWVCWTILGDSLTMSQALLFELLY